MATIISNVIEVGVCCGWGEGVAGRGDVCCLQTPDPEVIKLCSCSTQLSMNFSLLMNMKMANIIGIFVFISREKNHAQLCLARKNLQLLVILDLLTGQISCSAELSMKKFYNPRACSSSRLRDTDYLPFLQRRQPLWFPVVYFPNTKPRGYNTYFMLNSAEHEICPPNKSQIINSSKFFIVSRKYDQDLRCPLT